MPAQHKVVKRAVGHLGSPIAARHKVFLDVCDPMLAHDGFMNAYEPALQRAGSQLRQNL